MSTVDIETILMEVGHRVSLMQSGKTLAPFMFKEEADQIRTTLKAELLAKIPKGTKHCPNIDQEWCDDCLREHLDDITKIIKDM